MKPTAGSRALKSEVRKKLMPYDLGPRRKYHFDTCSRLMFDIQQFVHYRNHRIIEPSANGDATLADEGRSESHKNSRLSCDLHPAPLLYNVEKILAEPAKILKQHLGICI